MPLRTKSIIQKLGVLKSVAIGAVLCWEMSVLILAVSGNRAILDVNASLMGVLLLGLIVWALLTRGHWGMKSDQVLLDCGTHPSRKLFRIGAGLCLFMTVLLTTTAPDSTSATTALALYGLLFLGFVMFSRSRLQFGEVGLWVFTRLLSWNKIESFRWAAWGDKSTLLVKMKVTKFYGLSFAPVSVHVRPEQKDAAEKILQQHGAVRHERPTATISEVAAGATAPG